MVTLSLSCSSPFHCCFLRDGLDRDDYQPSLESFWLHVHQLILRSPCSEWSLDFSRLKVRFFSTCSISLSEALFLAFGLWWISCFLTFPDGNKVPCTHMTQIKMGRLGWTFLKRRYTNIQQIYENDLRILCHREMEDSPRICGNGCFCRTREKFCWGCGMKGSLVYHWHQNSMICPPECKADMQSALPLPFRIHSQRKWVGLWETLCSGFTMSCYRHNWCVCASIDK